MNYPEYILEILRQRKDLEEDDTSRDEEFQNLSANEVFDEVIKWDGLGNYADTIKQWVQDIYSVDLNACN